MKQKKIINVFYISLFAAMILALLMIYLVRVYIHKQMKKHAIHDHDTHLFNQKYFLAELHTTVARAKRENSPLSMFFLSVDNFGTYDAKQQKYLAQKTAHILSTVTRDSDTVCRYDDDHFAVLMPLADQEHAIHLEERMREAVKGYDFHLTPEPQFSFKTTQLNDNETEEDFIERSRK
ncbi:GGDEF domain-containing protein [Sulfurovum riftiae]|nr:GGDEF domain-containing protein [Sulfurovum riftiae]